MDLSKIKNRLDNLNQSSKPKNTEKKDYTLIYWKPKAEGKFQIRFVPSKLNKDNPFQEIFMHYGIGKFPIVALTNWGENDPVVEFSKKLRTSSDSENWRLAKQLDPKMRVFAPVIVRGEEEKGVRLFEFSKTLYMELLSVADDEDYGDFTDINQGFDFVVTATKVQDRPGFGLSLQTFISGGEETEGSITSEPAVAFEAETPAKEEKKFTLSTQGTPKKAKSEEFDSLFDDDLPF